MTRSSMSLLTGVVIATSMVLQVACAQAPASPSPTSASRLSAAASATGGTDRPFSGECRTTFEFVTPAAGTELPAATEGLVTKGFVRFVGTCTLTHLGNAATEALERLEGPPDTPPEVITKIENIGSYTAANGDKLTFRMAGDVTPGAEEWPVLFAGTVTFTGGAGRFVTASGSGLFEGGARFESPSAGVGYFVHPQGTISY